MLWVWKKEAHARVSSRTQTYALAHGSFVGWPAAAANFCGSKPVRLGRGAIVLSVWVVRGSDDICIARGLVPVSQWRVLADLRSA
jgi:hypothetical protein